LAKQILQEEESSTEVDVPENFLVLDAEWVKRKGVWTVLLAFDERSPLIPEVIAG